MENKIKKNDNLTISAILVVLAAISIIMTSNTNTGNDVFAKYSNSPQTQNQVNNCKIGTVGGVTCGINGVQTQGDHTVSSPVLSQTSDVVYLDRNNINIDSAVNQQNSGDTSSSGSSGATNGGNGCGDCAADNAANNGGVDANGITAGSEQSPENEQNQVEETTQGITSDPFILPFSGN
jgi:hypothetical protein